MNAGNRRAVALSNGQSDKGVSARSRGMQLLAMRHFKGAAVVALLLFGATGRLSRATENYFVEEGVSFYAFEVGAEFRQPLYRLIGPGGLHTFTTSMVWRDKLISSGFKEEPSGIYVLAAAREGAKRLFQFVRTSDGKQVILTTSEECRKDLLARRSEFQEIESECYVFPPEFNPTFEHLSPVYCLRNPFADERMYVLSRTEIADILSAWEGRKKQLWKEVVVDSLKRQGCDVQELVPVGCLARVGDLEWRFEEDKELGKEIENGRSIKARGNTVFVCFHVRITNVGATPVPLRAPEALSGRPQSRMPMSAAATEAHLKDVGAKPIAGMTLAPGESVLAHCVYDVPQRSPHIVIEAYGGPSAPNTVVLLDTGR